MQLRTRGAEINIEIAANSFINPEILNIKLFKPDKIYPYQLFKRYRS